MLAHTAVRQVDRETGKIIGMAAIVANEPSCLRAAIGRVSYCMPAATNGQVFRDARNSLRDLFSFSFLSVARRPVFFDRGGDWLTARLQDCAAEDVEHGARARGYVCRPAPTRHPPKNKMFQIQKSEFRPVLACFERWPCTELTGGVLYT